MHLSKVRAGRRRRVARSPKEGWTISTLAPAGHLAKGQNRSNHAPGHLATRQNRPDRPLAIWPEGVL